MEASGVVLKAAHGVPPGESDALHGKRTPAEEAKFEDLKWLRFAPQVFGHVDSGGAPGLEYGVAYPNRLVPAGRPHAGEPMYPTHVLAEDELVGLNRAPATLTFWCPTPLDGDAVVIPLVTELGRLIHYAHRKYPGGGELTLRMIEKASGVPTIKIGWSAISPPVLRMRQGWTNPWWLELDDFWRVQESAGPILLSRLADVEGGIYYDPSSVSYTLPVGGWTAGPRPLDPLLVGLGNYMPKEGDYLFVHTDTERKAIEAFEAEMGAGLAGYRAAEGSGDATLMAEASARATTFNTLREMTKQKQKLEEEIEIANEKSESTTKLIEERNKVESEMNALPEYKEAMGLESPLRRTKGPFMAGVKKWAYRFDAHKPPGGLPDLTTSSGYFIIRISAPLAQRWMGVDTALSTWRFDWPGSWSFGVPGGTLAHPDEASNPQNANVANPFEMDRHRVTRTQVAVSRALTGRVVVAHIRGDVSGTVTVYPAH